MNENSSPEQGPGFLPGGDRGKVAIVTGGGSGLGYAIAAKFIQQGITTIIAGRDKEKLDKAKEQLGDLCHAMVCDVSELSSIPAFVDDVIKQFGKVDILVNNAGINMKKDFTEVSDLEFQSILTTNVTAVFALSREVVKHMLAKASGNIIHISSMAAQYGLPKVIAYSASKTAIDGMTRAMAVELSPKGIRVNAIAPGFIYSAMTDKALNSDPERKVKVFGRTPMGYMGQPEDIGEAAYFLASDAAKYITGVVLPVDGGNSIGF
jgi:NAD(P)-dependent dehydrogenase (short-subunit alcohol dehydrogenase family)